MRGKGCSAEFMHHFESLARKHGWEPGQTKRGIKKPIIQKLSYHYCLQPNTVYDLLRVIDLQAKKAIWHMPNSEAPQPGIVAHACRVGNEDAAREIIQQAMDQGWTAKDVSKEVSRRKREDRLALAPKLPPVIGRWEPDSIYCTDVASITLPENTIDFLCTDPPWTDKSLSVYGEVSSLASLVLRPGAFCAIYAGKMFLPEILCALEEGLEYIWTFAAVQFDNNSKIAKWHLFEAWRPILLFRKPGLSRDMPWIPDAFRCTREKTHHEWQQGSEPIRQLIEAYCPAGGIVLDPCVGGGTVPAVAQSLGRHFLGFDRDPDSVRLSLARLKEEKSDSTTRI